MNINFQITPNLKIYYIEANATHYEGEKEIIDTYYFAMEFYGKYYEAFVCKDEKSDSGISYASLSGDSDLFDSFEDQMEEYEEIIKSKVDDFDTWHGILN